MYSFNLKKNHKFVRLAVWMAFPILSIAHNSVYYHTYWLSNLNKVRPSRLLKVIPQPLNNRDYIYSNNPKPYYSYPELFLIRNTNSWRVNHAQPLALGFGFMVSWKRSERELQMTIHNSCAPRPGCSSQLLRSRHFHECGNLQASSINRLH